MGATQVGGQQLGGMGDVCTAAGRMSPRMLQTLELLSNGDAEKEVALKLGLSQHTVHVYVKALYRRFGVNSRAQLLAAVYTGARSLTEQTDEMMGDTSIVGC
jgi:DNA-binding NarL/FixJ family response regulator